MEQEVALVLRKKLRLIKAIGWGLKKENQVVVFQESIPCLLKRDSKVYGMT
jgi:hypothetical protein